MRELQTQRQSFKMPEAFSIVFFSQHKTTNTLGTIAWKVKFMSGDGLQLVADNTNTETFYTRRKNALLF